MRYVQSRIRVLTVTHPSQVFELQHDLPAPEPAPVDEELVSMSRVGRKRKTPRALLDFLPTTTAGLPSHISHPARKRKKPGLLDPSAGAAIAVDIPGNCSAEVTPGPEAELAAADPPSFETEPNSFGVYRHYTTKPSTDPEEEITLDSLCDAPTFAIAPSLDSGDESSLPTCGFGKSLKADFFVPFLNATVFRLMDWFYSTSNAKSSAALDQLVHNVILAEDFNREDLRNFSTTRELDRLDKYSDTSAAFSAEDGWQEGSVSIRLPNAKAKHKSEADAPSFAVGGIYYRRLIEVIKAAYRGSSARKYHWIPHKLFYKPDNGTDSSGQPGCDESEDIRVFSELYNSDAMIEEDAKIRAHLSEPGNKPDDNPDIEIAIAPIMVWSDSTHLANFGAAALWPIYLYFGSLSKYFRGKPTNFAAHHLAYIPKVGSFFIPTHFLVTFVMVSASGHASGLLSKCIQDSRNCRCSEILQA